MSATGKRKTREGVVVSDKMDKTKPWVPRFVFTATNVKTGSLWRFAKPFMADYRVGMVDKPKVSLALAVASSSAFPPFLSPLRMNLDPFTFRAKIVQVLRELIGRFKKLCSDTPVTYYSKGTGPDHWAAVDGLPIACMGIDWRHDITQVLVRYAGKRAIQGNVDPQWLFLDEATGALDEASEAALYQLMIERLPNTAIVSIGHRASLAPFHQRFFALKPDETGRHHLREVPPSRDTPARKRRLTSPSAVS